MEVFIDFIALVAGSSLFLEIEEVEFRHHILDIFGNSILFELICESILREKFRTRFRVLSYPSINIIIYDQEEQLIDVIFDPI
jgi:hypothetical protein